ncbi:glycosyltransferase family 4 protein [Methanohalophilus euhalobius]|uniref:Glycogen synthase (ADP-glucose) n=1 Tax=Methanohalophilus euhalobius TaxID=51203 RepID=A0A314ZWP1_9EURY|nr:glycosyltransferase family 4 protein [Methanohalophilus euhalobius]PQV43482.1 glycogen synthase (ADP-glucose) [Methanohalophilus euhalobius]RNI07360.1 glycosyltransferase family 1 protein [Methanohalophilus euhalobius]
MKCGGIITVFSLKKTDSGANIGILSYEYPPNFYGGVGIHVGELTRSLAIGNNQVHVFTSSVQTLNEQLIRNLWVHGPTELHYQTSNNFSAAYKKIQTNINVAAMVKKQFSGGSLDLLHSHGGLIQLATTLSKESTQLPLVMTAHSIDINRTKPDGLSVMMESNVVGMVDRFIAVSKSIQEELEQTFGIEHDKITIIPNGVDSETFKHQNADDIKRKYKLDNRFVVLFVGRNDSQKGVMYLVDAVRRLQKDIPEIMLVMVGQPDIYHDKHILCLPHVDKHELIKLYSLSDVFVLPSIYEPFGIVLIEAMACETACIGTRVGGIPDIIDHNRTGVLVEPESCASIAEAIDRLYHDPEKRCLMGKRGREKVISYFDWQNIAKKTGEVYQQVLN